MTQVETDAAVLDAQSRLGQAQAQVRSTTLRLDELAATYENALAHAERLQSELAGAGDRIERAEQALREARAAHSAQARQAYKQPGLDFVRISGAFLLSPDVGSALHASAIMERVTAHRAAAVADVTGAGRQIVTDVGTQRGVAGGSVVALRELDRMAETFTAALENASAEASSAQTGLDDAVQDAEERAAAAAAAAAAASAAAAAAAAQQSFASVVPLDYLAAAGAPRVFLATINGGQQQMACPLGQPNGFIDSWGFPRSGGRSHKGVDMFAARGMPIFAAADGYIRRVANGGLGGLTVDLVDGLGNRYYYAHLSATYVVSGQQVGVGQLIAANGDSGNARTTPPHLHWQFHPADGGPVNPFPVAAALCR